MAEKVARFLLYLPTDLKEWIDQEIKDQRVKTGETQRTLSVNSWIVALLEHQREQASRRGAATHDTEL